VVNVASYKNVDEPSLLKIPGVVYVPLVGKVTVAMLERNLMRLFQQFHHPQLQYKRLRHLEAEPVQLLGGIGTPLQLYTALAVTVLLAVELLRK